MKNTKPAATAKITLPIRYCNNALVAVSKLISLRGMMVCFPNIRPPVKRLPNIIKGIIGGILMLEARIAITLFSLRKWAETPAKIIW